MYLLFLLLLSFIYLSRNMLILIFWKKKKIVNKGVQAKEFRCALCHSSYNEYTFEIEPISSVILSQICCYFFILSPAHFGVSFIDITISMWIHSNHVPISIGIFKETIITKFYFIFYLRILNVLSVFRFIHVFLYVFFVVVDFIIFGCLETVITN